jgi:hypothetical protein
MFTPLSVVLWSETARLPFDTDRLGTYLFVIKCFRKFVEGAGFGYRIAYFTAKVECSVGHSWLV